MPPPHKYLECATGEIQRLCTPQTLSMSHCRVTRFMYPQNISLSHCRNTRPLYLKDTWHVRFYRYKVSMFQALDMYLCSDTRPMYPKSSLHVRLERYKALHAQITWHVPMMSHKVSVPPKDLACAIWNIQRICVPNHLTSVTVEIQGLYLKQLAYF